MKSTAANDATIEQTAPQDEPPLGSTVLENVLLLWHELRGVTHAHLQLAALETRRAGESFVAMIIAGIIVAILLMGAWLGFMAAIVLRLIEQGIAASSAILCAVAVNLLFALIFCAVIRSKSRYLQFPVILRSLQPRQPTH